MGLALKDGIWMALLAGLGVILGWQGREAAGHEIWVEAGRTRRSTVEGGRARGSGDWAAHRREWSK